MQDCLQLYSFMLTVAPVHAACEEASGVLFGDMTGWWFKAMLRDAVVSTLTLCPAAVSLCCRSGRNLTWQTNMGTVDLKGMFDKRYEFSVSDTPTAPARGARCASHSSCRCAFSYR
jgi:hypothetical protein